MNEHEEKIIKGNIKLTVFNSFDFNKIKKICEVICELGYDCYFVDNGNIVFQEKENGK